MYCSTAMEAENLESIDYDSFQQFIWNLVDQDLLQSNCDDGGWAELR